jgi:sRNA-binding regulator protein Hfq
MPISESFEQYGRVKEPKRHRSQEAKSGENATREKPQAFLEAFDGTRVKVTLLNGREFIGRLQTTRYNKYELLVDGLLLFKHAVASIEKLGDGDGE